MTDIMATICLVQMEKLQANLEWRRHIRDDYDRRLSVKVKRPVKSETVQYYYIRVPHDVRDMFIDYLAERKIHTSVHFKPLHMYNVMKEHLMFDRDYPVSSHEWKGLVTIPCHGGMSDVDIDYVVFWINKFFDEK